MPETQASGFVLADVIATHERELVNNYVAAQKSTRAAQLMNTDEVRRQCTAIVNHLRRGENYNPDDPAYQPLRQMLDELSRTRALQGFSPVETASFVFSLKETLLPLLQQTLAEQPQELTQQVTGLNRLLDAFGLRTFESYNASRESLIREQSRSILELSTPVVQVWEGILALPIVGAVDTARTQQIMENLLTKIVETGSSVVIIDITGVAVVDTAVAKHLLQTVAAARLLGAEALIVGVSARIAQTLVHLGIDLSDIITRTSLAKGLEYALWRTGQRIIRVGDAPIRGNSYTPENLTGV
jgi:rsbT co-antagonist protein RsbR